MCVNDRLRSSGTLALLTVGDQHALEYAMSKIDIASAVLAAELSKADPVENGSKYGRA
jgi:hypothetical protein